MTKNHDKPNKTSLQFTTVKCRYHTSKLVLESKTDPNEGEKDNFTPLLMTVSGNVESS